MNPFEEQEQFEWEIVKILLIVLAVVIFVVFSLIIFFLLKNHRNDICFCLYRFLTCLSQIRKNHNANDDSVEMISIE